MDPEIHVWIFQVLKLYSMVVVWNPKSVIKFLWCNFLKDYQQNMADLSKLLLVRGLW